ncbi:MAG: ribonuclease HII [Robiginitomaculum sp.]|nr:MAG: ribonuclease HII [Robiginitomaculum sp.]
MANITKPDYTYENAYSGAVAGVDEAGRGPLAGPVVTAAVILDVNNIPSGLNDSKKLSEKKREILFDKIMSCAQVGVGISEPEEIDRINILAATLVAMRRAVLDLPSVPCAVLIDGNKCPDLNIPTEAIVKGDAKSLSIAAASIIAKVTRDRLMVQADARFPGYGHSGHKGYPTKSHRQALVDIGASPIHRRSYAPVRNVLTANASR